MLGAHIFIFELGRLVLCRGQRLGESAGEINLDVLAFNTVAPRELPLQTALEGCHVDGHVLEQRRHDAIFELAENQ